MEKTKSHWIEIYESNFFLIVTDNLDKSRNSKKSRKLFSEYRVSPNTSGLACAANSNHAIYLHKDKMQHSLISHEIMHVVFHIMESIGHKFDEDGPEPWCYLSGHITKLVYQDLKKWKIRIK